MEKLMRFFKGYYCEMQPRLLGHGLFLGVSLLLSGCGSGEDPKAGQGDAAGVKTQNTPVNKNENVTEQNPVEIVKKTRSNSGNILSSAYMKGVAVVDIQRIKQLATLAMQFQLIQGRWPESQDEFIKEMSESKPLFGSNQKAGVRKTAELIYLPPANRNSIQAEPIIFIADASGKPDRSQSQGYTDGSVKKP